MWKTFQVILIFAAFSLISQVQAEAGSLYYILDGSGSMWGRVEGEMKIQSAKEILIQMVNETPDDMMSGLTVYGHRKKGDCSDIEEMIPLGTLDRDRSVDLISQIKPRGRTPIAESIRMVAGNLQNHEDETTVILISDGIETCGKDPCEVTRALKASGINFVMHVVGFDVDQDASEQLSCIAQAGGGQYFPSANAVDLLQALSTVHKSITENTTLPVSFPAPAPEKLIQKVTGSSTSIRIKAKGPGKISFQYSSWLKQPYYWKLIDPETGEEKGRFSSLGTTMVAPGQYQIVWDQYEHASSEVTLAEVVSITPGKTSQVPLLTALRLNLPSWVPKPKYWGLRDPQTLEALAIFNLFEPFLVPAGDYELIWRQGEHTSKEIAIQKVRILPDTLNDVTVATAFNPIAADWVQDSIHYWGLKKKGGAQTDEWIAWYRDRFAPQLVPPGSYSVFYDLSQHGSSDSYLGDVEVKDGMMNEFPVNTGVVFIPSDGLKPPYFIEFIELDKTGKAIRTVRLNRSFGPLALKPGIYRIDYRQEEHGATTMTIVDAFELPQGTLVEIEL